MADNFRNKQWFKNMSQDRKDEICKNFDISEKTLRKCGRETEDGRIVIDLLRLDHLEHHPEYWDDCHKALDGHKEFLERLQNAGTHEEYVEIFKDLYDLFGANKYLKYKETSIAKVQVGQAYKHILTDMTYYFDCKDEDKPYFAYMINTHLRVILDSDLKLIKK